ncbi:MAG: hypothetical protein IKI84_01165 [Clostridia bacterium]|nr:hypothetical protein [Clostridia bacterium]
MNHEKKYNKALCKKYPFLIPYSGRKGMEDGPIEDTDYDWEYTELDFMPRGWAKAFGMQMCDELKAELEVSGDLYRYRVLEVKEKWGELRWYDYGGNRQTEEIIEKYSRISRRTCISCGKPAIWITRGWISPYCDECLPGEDGHKWQADRIEEVYREEPE